MTNKTNAKRMEKNQSLNKYNGKIAFIKKILTLHVKCDCEMGREIEENITTTYAPEIERYVSIFPDEIVDDVTAIFNKHVEKCIKRYKLSGKRDNNDILI